MLPTLTILLIDKIEWLVRLGMMCPCRRSCGKFVGICCCFIPIPTLVILAPLGTCALITAVIEILTTYVSCRWNTATLDPVSIMVLIVLNWFGVGLQHIWFNKKPWLLLLICATPPCQVLPLNPPMLPNPIGHPIPLNGPIWLLWLRWRLFCCCCWPKRGTCPSWVA